MTPVRRTALTITAECLALRTRRINRTMSRIYDEELRPHGLGAAQLNLLVALGVAGELRPARLAELLDLEKSTLSRNLRRMDQRGWVVIESRPGSGQSVQLTPEGEELLRNARPAWERAQARARTLLKADLYDALLDLSVA